MEDRKKIREKLTSIWSCTELEMDDSPKSELHKNLKKVSSIVNEILIDMDKLNACSVCNYEICDKCIKEMERNLSNKALHRVGKK